MRWYFKVEEWKVSIRWNLLGQPIDYEHGDDSYTCIKWRVDARGMSFHIRWTSKRKFAPLQTMVLALFDYHLMKHQKCSIILKSELLLGQSKSCMASRRSGSLVFVVCSTVHDHGWSFSGWLSRCVTAWVSKTSSKFHQAFMFALDLDHWQLAITGNVSQHHDGSVSIGMSSLDTIRIAMLKGTFLTPSGFGR